MHIAPLPALVEFKGIQPNTGFAPGQKSDYTLRFKTNADLGSYWRQELPCELLGDNEALDEPGLAGKGPQAIDKVVVACGSGMSS